MTGNSETLKVGDDVRLKSGSPQMTVDDTYNDHGLVTCKWFDGAELKSGHFSGESLTKNIQSNFGV